MPLVTRTSDKMKTAVFFLFTVLLGCALALDKCNPSKCKAPNCVCASMNKPIENLPQLVVLSFDDSASRLVFDEFWKPVLFDRKNPDGCHIGGTFYVPHEYSDYEVVNILYNKGFEIGSHSITKNPLQTYWRNLSQNDTVREMGGQKTILSTFANIPAADIKGARIPLLEFNNHTFAALKQAGFLFDNSWATLSNKPYFPHTMDYQSEMNCFLSLCQAESVPGFWELPIVDWVDMQEHNCNKLLACEFEGKEEVILDWLKAQFTRTYNGNRAPFSVLINYAVFNYVENSLGALKKFLDYLATLKDVFLVNDSQVIEWMQNPVTKDKFKSCVTRKPAACSAVVCPLNKGENDVRYMKSCVPCPSNYPWLDNPTGKSTY